MEVHFVFHVTEEGREKGNWVVGKFSLELFVRITFPFPWVWLMSKEVVSLSLIAAKLSTFLP